MMRGLLAGTVLGGIMAAACMAAVPAHAQVEAAMSFQISAQPLIPALVAFSDQSGLQLFFDSALARDLKSPGVSGSMTAETALRQLLSGTGMTYRFTNPRTVTLERATAQGAVTLDPVTVEGTAAPRSTESAYGPVQGYVAKRSASGTKTDTPLVEVPQTVNVVTADQMAATKAQSLQDALAYTPGVVGREGADRTSDNFTIRGFQASSASGSIYRDGAKYSVNSYDGQQDPYGLERVELLKGAASILYGAAAPGGVINTVTKRPTTAPLREINVEYGSYDRKQVSTDLGGAVTEDGSLAYRLTALKRESDTFVDHVPDDRTYVAPALTWKPDERTSLTLLAHYQESRSAYIYGLPAEVTILPNASGRMSSSTFVGEPGYDKAESTIISVGYLFEHGFNDNVKLNNSLRYFDTRLDMPSMWVWSVAADGRTTAARGAQDRRDLSSAYTTDTSLEVKWRTGAIEHTSLAGIDFIDQNHTTRRYNRDGSNIDLYAPSYGTSLGAPSEASFSSRSGMQHLGVYAQNQMKIHDRLVLLLGGRQDWAETRASPYFSGKKWTKRRDEAFSGRAGLVYLFDNGIAPFASYSESFLPEDDTDRRGKTFEPTTGQQYELGVRYQPPGTNALVSAAVYELTRQNVKTPDPADTNFSIQTGEVRSRGFEFEVKAEPLPHLNVAGGYAYTDGRVTQSNTAGETGRRNATVPYNQFSLWGDYTLAEFRLPEITAGMGLRFVDTTLPSVNVKGEVPSYTVFDAMVRYDLDQSWRFTVNAANLFDRDYIASCTYGCFFGERRKVIGTLSYRW